MKYLALRTSSSGGEKTHIQTRPFQHCLINARLKIPVIFKIKGECFSDCSVWKEVKGKLDLKGLWIATSWDMSRRIHFRNGAHQSEGGTASAKNKQAGSRAELQVRGHVDRVKEKSGN